MRGVIVPAEGPVSIVDISGTLKSLQDAVGGYIEIVRVPMPFEDDVMVVDEEGLYKGLPLNVLGSFLYGTHIHGSPVVGNVLILKEALLTDGADFVDMPDVRAHRDAYDRIRKGLMK